MAVLIKETQSGRFYRSFNKWTYDPATAFDFAEPARATKWIHAVNLIHVEIVETELRSRKVSSNTGRHQVG